MVERTREDELPISPEPHSPVPEIFSSKKIFFLNSSCSGSRRSEIPHMESDYCPRDEVSRRLFPRSNDSCDCDCMSDGCWGCLRRNKQCFFKFFVLTLSIVLVLLLFGSLSYNLTRSKTPDESSEFDRTEWISHYHEYPALEDKETSKTSTSLGIEPILDFPVPVYQSSDDYDSGEDSQKLQELVDPSNELERVEPISFLPFNKHGDNSQNTALIIYDGREPLRTRRSRSSRRRPRETNSLKEKLKTLKELAMPEEESDHLFRKLNGIKEGMEKFWKNYLKKKRIVFEPLSLTTPLHTASSANEEFEDEMKIRFLREIIPAGFSVKAEKKSHLGKKQRQISRIGWKQFSFKWDQ